MSSEIIVSDWEAATCSTCGTTFWFYELNFDDVPSECTDCWLDVDPSDPRHRGNDKDYPYNIDWDDIDRQSDGFGV